MHNNVSSGSATVFVVDDDPDVRDGLDTLFQSVGLKCLAFPSPSVLLMSKLPDEASCLILDVRMPELSGLDFQAELAKARIETPIIFITGHGDIPMSVKAMKGGAVEFLTKPLREQDLLDAVRAALQRDCQRREQERETQDLRARFEGLSSREQEVMGLVCAGLMNKQSAAEIGVSEVTVKVHRHNVMKKLGARSLADLVRMAATLGVSPRKAASR
jgi:FixJ family two-component response regulator